MHRSLWCMVINAKGKPVSSSAGWLTLCEAPGCVVNDATTQEGQNVVRFDVAQLED